MLERHRVRHHYANMYFANEIGAVQKVKKCGIRKTEFCLKVSSIVSVGGGGGIYCVSVCS